MLFPYNITVSSFDIISLCLWYFIKGPLVLKNKICGVRIDFLIFELTFQVYNSYIISKLEERE